MQCSDGSFVEDPNHVGDLFLQYWRNIMTSNDHNDYIITHKLFQPIISHENNMKLTEIPTDEENYSTINSFKD